MFGHAYYGSRYFGAGYFGPAAGAGLTLDLSDDTFNLADALVQSIEYHISLTDDANILADSEAHVSGVAQDVSDALELLTDEQAQLLVHLLAFSDNVASLDDIAILQLEQREELSDSFTLSDEIAVTLNYELIFADSINTLSDVVTLALTHRLIFADTIYTFPSTPVLDSFNRADEDPATGWTRVFTSAAGIRVLNNQASAPQSGETAYSIFTALASGDEQEVYVGVSTGQVSGGAFGSHAYLLLRFTGQTSDSATGYLVDAFSTFIRVYRVDALASFTVLSTQEIATPLSAGEKFGARMRGSVLETWIEQGAGWTLIDTVTDSTYPSGQVGIGIFSANNDLLLDDFGGGAIAIGLRDEFTQQLEIVDSGALTLGLVDSLASLSDVLELGYGLSFIDSTTISDAAIRQLDHLITFNDSLVLTDDESHTLNYNQELADTITLSDEQSQQLAHLLKFADSIDNLSDGYALLLAHLLNLGDSHALDDSTALLLVHLLDLDDDSNLLSDAIDTSAEQGPLREVGVTDSVDTLVDGIVLQLDYLLAVEDAITLTDTAALIAAHHLTFDDNAANWADSVAFTYGLALILNDNAVVLSDNLTALFTHALALADSLVLSDSLTAFGEHFLQAADSLVLNDDLDIELRGPEFTVVFEDILVLSDAVSLSLNDEVQYQIVLTDTIVLTDHYFDLRRPYTPSAKRHIVVPSRARETVVTGERVTRVPASARTTKVT